MSILPRHYLAGFAIALFLSGCAHLNQITEADALRIADRAATKAGVRLADFEPRPVVVRKGNDWLVMYEGKTPPPLPDGRVELKLGNHFTVLVDDRTGEARIMGGK
jgi:hypothetical protein